jgi:thiamine transport system substrate-binding protein
MKTRPNGSAKSGPAPQARPLFPAISVRRAFPSALAPALLLALALLPWLASCAKAKDAEGPLVIWTYDSFVSEWGPGPAIAELYAKETGGAIRFMTQGDGGALLAALLRSGANTDADLVIGLDNFTAPRALAANLLDPYKPKIADTFPPGIMVDPKDRLLPYDFGQFAIIWDKRSRTPPPASLEDLASPAYRKKLILMDPRTSTPGLGFLAWTQAVYGEGWKDYWARLAPSVLAMTPGWDTGYGLFTSGEAPLVLSYVTSPAYHKAAENSDRYRALLFPEGHVAQVELAGILASSRRKQGARAFMDFFLSTECQSLLPETQWMLPANPAVTLPDSFGVVRMPEKTLEGRIADPVTDPETAAGILAAGAR